MPIEDLLQRPGLAPEIRILVRAAVAIWSGNWPVFEGCVDAASGRGQARQDFEEMLLQAVLFCGFPRVITAFGRLDARWPAAVPPAGGSLPDDERKAAGSALFGAVYGQNDQAVRAMLQNHHQELHDFVLEAAYGRILTRPHLAARTRELLAVAILAAQGQARQFAGHARGALHLGATTIEIEEALHTTFADHESASEQVDAWLARMPRKVERDEQRER